MLRRGNGGEPSTLDPQRSGDHYSDEILRDLFEGLVTEAPDGSLQPGTATTWTVSPDGLTYTFTLRDNAKWSDGSPHVADDFVRAFRVAVTPATAAPAADLLRPIAGAAAALTGSAEPSSLGVEATDAHTVVIHLESPTGYFLSALTHPMFFPRHPTADQANRPAVERVGNGPYQLVNWAPNDHIEVRKSSTYWDASHVNIDRVRFYPIATESDEFLRYRAGDLDMTAAVPTNQLETARKERPKELRLSPYLGTYFLGFNMQRPPFAGNADLRRALSLAIDRDVIASRVLNGAQRTATSLVPVGTANYASQSDPALLEAKATRLKLAKELFAKATAGKPALPKIRLIYGNSETVRSALVAVAAMWKEAFGIDVDIVTEEFKVFLDTQKNPDSWEMVRMAWVADFNDPVTFLQLFRSDDPSDIFGYRSPRYDELLSEAERTVDPAARLALLEQAERLLLDDAALIPLFHMQAKRMVSPRVVGFHATPLNRTYSKHLSFAK
jgi:oligopeptide transport system substrate-binding protein